MLKSCILILFWERQRRLVIRIFMQIMEMTLLPAAQIPIVDIQKLYFITFHHYSHKTNLLVRTV